jgi:signal transduction histidine kinase
MAGIPDAPAEREKVLHLSHRLVALHVCAVALLIGVVLSTTIWISAEHNKLAQASSERLVSTGLNAFRARLYTLVKDYSIWDEAYDAVVADDRDWLYSNVGTAATEIGTIDMLLIDNPAAGEPYGWVEGSPEGGLTGLIEHQTVAQLRTLLKRYPISDASTRTLIAVRGGEVWVFAVARIRPVDGLPAGVSEAELPVQVHGMRLPGPRLEQIGATLLIDDLHLAAAAEPGKASVTLRDAAGAPVALLAWNPPRPGASILGRVALPLSLALAAVVVISVVSSRLAVGWARRLERALHAAKAADRSKSEFLSNVSHEIRTPMNGIFGAAQLLRMTELTDEQRELVSVLFSSAQTQMSLITDLLELSQMEGGARQLDAAPFAPAATVKDVADMMRLVAAKKAVGLEVEASGIQGLGLLGDERALRQIVTNLLGNAIKFTERGRVRLEAAALPQDDGRVRLEIAVADTGPGIPAAALPHVFERFYRVDNSLARTTEGTGLGLAISRRLARLMGGEITAASVEGQGSRFVFVAAFDRAGEASDALDAA